MPPRPTRLAEQRARMADSHRCMTQPVTMVVCFESLSPSKSRQGGTAIPSIVHITLGKVRQASSDDPLGRSWLGYTHRRRDSTPAP